MDRMSEIVYYCCKKYLVSIKRETFNIPFISKSKNNKTKNYLVTLLLGRKINVYFFFLE